MLAVFLLGVFFTICFGTMLVLAGATDWVCDLIDRHPGWLGY